MVTKIYAMVAVSWPPHLHNNKTNVRWWCLGPLLCPAAAPAAPVCCPPLAMYYVVTGDHIHVPLQLRLGSGPGCQPPGYALSLVGYPNLAHTLPAGFELKSSQ